MDVDKIDLNNKHFEAYQISFFENPFNVIFYDAQQAKIIQSEDEVKSAYHQMFWDEIPVIVVTQYSSAGNGVNLQYRPTENSPETDFSNIHLLDTPYFFFDQINASEGTISDIDTSIQKEFVVSS